MNNKKKLLKVNAAICFNKLCRHYQLTPKYMNIKMNGKNKQTHNTKNSAVQYSRTTLTQGTGTTITD
jgi:hypothetical protein